VPLLSGGSGARVSVAWAESLFVNTPGDRWGNRPKDNRDAVEGKLFAGPADEFVPDGSLGRRFEPLWWQCGRYVELRVTTADSPLTLDGIELRETRYPGDLEARFASDDAGLDDLFAPCARTLQMCRHETFFDCPHYEQLQYLSDSCLVGLASAAMFANDKLFYKAIDIANASRQPTGFLRSRYPSREPQNIPTFTPPWVESVHQYALWGGAGGRVRRRLLPGVRASVEAYASHLNPDGLMAAPAGWNFFDWVPDAAWRFGVAPGGDTGVSPLLNWQFAYMLAMVEELETHLGEPEFAARARRLRQGITGRLVSKYWNNSRGLFAEDERGTLFCEHSQALALLGGAELGAEVRDRLVQNLLHGDGLTRGAPFFAHYVIEACRTTGRGGEALRGRLPLWFEMRAAGLVTTIEDTNIPATRSDRHAWTAHPAFHCLATLLGIRPAAFGFERVRVAPQPAGLKRASGRCVHPRGSVDVALEVGQDHVRADVTLPDGVHGEFVMHGKQAALRPGRQTIEF